MMETSEDSEPVLPPLAAVAKPRPKSANLAVMFLMTLNIILGGGIAWAGYYLLESLGLALTGAGLATVSIFVMLFYQLWGTKS